MVSVRHIKYHRKEATHSAVSGLRDSSLPFLIRSRCYIKFYAFDDGASGNAFPIVRCPFPYRHNKWRVSAALRSKRSKGKSSRNGEKNRAFPHRRIDNGSLTHSQGNGGWIARCRSKRKWNHPSSTLKIIILNGPPTAKHICWHGRDETIIYLAITNDETIDSDPVWRVE